MYVGLYILISTSWSATVRQMCGATSEKGSSHLMAFPVCRANTHMSNSHKRAPPQKITTAGTNKQPQPHAASRWWTYLREMRFDFYILQPLLKERDEGTRRHPSLRDARLGHEGLVCECKRRVYEAYTRTKTTSGVHVAALCTVCAAATRSYATRSDVVPGHTNGTSNHNNTHLIPEGNDIPASSLRPRLEPWQPEAGYDDRHGWRYHARHSVSQARSRPHNRPTQW